MAARKTARKKAEPKIKRPPLSVQLRISKTNYEALWRHFLATSVENSRLRQELSDWVQRYDRLVEYSLKAGGVPSRGRK